MTFKSTITPEQEEAIRQRVTTHTLARGVGTTETACSIASINLALTGKLTDRIPDCMSPVIGQWIIGVQDAMPDAMRNSDEWRQLLPLAAGTGRELEAERLALILDWMWTAVLPSMQAYADKHGFGDGWRKMCADRTVEPAVAARWATAEARWAAEAARWARGAAKAQWAAEAARWAAEAAPMAWETFAPADLLRRLIECEAAS